MNAQQAYEATAVAATGFLRYDGSSTIEEFALEVEALRRMEAQGLLAVEFEHKNQQVGTRSIDMVRFVRLE